MDTVAELRDLPAEKIVGEMKRHHHLTVDGYALEELPYESYRKGIHNEEAILHGFNREESAPFILFSQANLKNYEQKVRDAFDDPFEDRVLELYPASSNREARRNWADIYTVVLFTYGHYCWEREAMENGIPSYLYHFTKENGRLGSWHSGELPYLYGNISEDSPLYDESDRALSETMLGYLRNFAVSGDPNGEELPVWLPSDGTFMVQEFGDEIAPAEDKYLELYAILDEAYKFKRSK